MSDLAAASPPPASPSDPRSAVSVPAIILMVVGGLNALMSLLAAGLNLFGAGIGAMGGGSEAQVPAFLTGTVGALINLVFFALYAFMFYGAYNMKTLKSYTMAMAASIVAMLPCALCCIIGLPVGIWALVVLNKPAVKMAFESRRGQPV